MGGWNGVIVIHGWVMGRAVWVGKETYILPLILRNIYIYREREREEEASPATGGSISFVGVKGEGEGYCGIVVG